MIRPTFAATAIASRSVNQGRGQVAPKLVENLVKSGVDRERIVTDPASQLSGWTAGLDFMEAQGWERQQGGAASIFHFQLSEDGGKIRQDAFFSRRDAEVYLETSDGEHWQRISIDRRREVIGDSGLVAIR